jgi:hypothetical protein
MAEMTSTDVPTYRFTALDGALTPAYEARATAARRDIFARLTTPSGDFADDEFEMHMANIASGAI